jgi:N-acetylglucosamine-6-phosphate deacetylase
MDGTLESLSGIARFHLSQGTTSFCSSTLSAPLGTLESVLQQGEEFLTHNREAALQGTEASCLGFHLEGPWLSRDNAGAHSREHIISPDPKSFELISRFGDIISMVTLSYSSEIDPFLQYLIEHGIIAAAGHDDTADFEILKGFAGGISQVTHLYSCTSTFQRRNGKKRLGTLEMALMTDGIAVEVIADGHHITKFFWNFIRHNKKLDDILLVSDSIKAAGLDGDAGRMTIGDIDIIIDGGVAWTSDRKLFAGSVATMYRMFLILVTEWGESIQDAVRFSSHNQARILGHSGTLGRIAPGMTADLLLMDEDLVIRKIVKSGRESAFSKE